VVENPIDTMILNALNWKFPEIDINLSNGFRFVRQNNSGSNRKYSYYKRIYFMLPVDSTVRTAKVTGNN
jgi:hypothetical protein